MDDNSVIDLEPLVRSAPFPRARLSFRYAGQSTKALLIVQTGRAERTYALAESDVHGHAESNLLDSPEWRSGLATAAGAARKSSPAQSLLYLIVSRTPCHGVLCDAQGRLLDSKESKRLSQVEARRKAKSDGTLTIAPGCASKLAEALKTFYLSLGDKSLGKHVRCILACRGTYEPTAEGTRTGAGTTTNLDLVMLLRAGWEIRALRVDGALSRHGIQLAQFVRRQRHLLQSQ